MRLIRSLVAFGIAVAGLLAVSLGLAQEKPGPTVGDRVDQAIEEVREGTRDLVGQVRETFAQVRARVERMSVAARVYARLHWDKALAQSSISVDVDKDGVATLTGTAPSEDAKSKADALAGDTVGIQRVVNNLKVVVSDRQ